MTNLTTHPHSRPRKVLRLAAAALGTLFIGLVAAVSWVLAQAQYINDYCTSRAPQPTPEPPGGRPAYMDGPWTVVCEYDGMPAVQITEPGPFIGAMVLALIVIGIGVAAFRWARRSTPPDRSDSPARETSTEPV